MIECPSCHTLNPEAERACLSCAAALSGPAPSGSVTMGMARCPAGHPIDPTWTSCPYCERTPAGLTRREGGAPPEPPARPRMTRLEPEAPRNGRPTMLQESQGSEKSSSIRRLLGVLAAPDAGPGGAVFPIRGGRNTIGASRENDIILTGDSEISGEHAAVLHRNGTFHLADRLSTNGTWLNGQEVPANGTLPLRDRDRIRCGGTELVFLVIEPVASATQNLD